MDFLPAIQSGFSNYFNFKSRATRSEYWNWYLFTIIVSILTTLLDNFIFNISISDHNALHPINVVFNLIVLIPTLALAVRRLHDVDRNGWWLLISITVIGAFFPLLYWFCSRGTRGPNQYGEDRLKED